MTLKGEFKLNKEENKEVIKHKEQSTKKTETSKLTFVGKISDFKATFSIVTFPEKILGIKENLGLTPRHKIIQIKISKPNKTIDEFSDSEIEEDEE